MHGINIVCLSLNPPANMAKYIGICLNDPGGQKEKPAGMFPNLTASKEDVYKSLSPL